VNLALTSSLISTGGIMLKRRDRRGVSGYGCSRCYRGLAAVDPAVEAPLARAARCGFPQRAGTETTRMTFLNLPDGALEFCLMPKMML
jgi:hypothetical protein